MALYKNRARSVEAFQVTADNIQELAVLTGGQAGESRNAVTDDLILDLRIPTMGGIVHAVAGDYILRSSAGTWHVLHKEAFEEEYEEQEADPRPPRVPQPRRI